MNDDTELAARLAALEAQAPTGAEPPSLSARGRRGRIALPVAMAPLLVFAAVATVAAGAAVIARTAEGYPGIENPGQPLEGAAMECMTPPSAAAFLSAHGFSRVDWQVETGTVLSADGGKGSSSSIHVSTPPAHGYVIPGSLRPDGSVVMVVDQRDGATGVGACFGEPMP